MKYLRTIMMKEEPRYEEWLTTIANTRLIYNTMEELETMLDNRSIHGNGIKRSFSTPQKLRAAFRDLKVEVELYTDGQLRLDSVMSHYRKAWKFYHEKLQRRTTYEEIAQELILYCYPPNQPANIPPKRETLYRHIIEHNLHIPFILLMLLKAIPGYESKDGDVIDMPRLFERVMSFFEKLAVTHFFHHLFPSITQAREEPHKTRIMLLFHVSQILHIHESYAANENMYDMTDYLKQNRVGLNIEGYWNECEGKLLYTHFWQIEPTADDGTYFMTHWHKDADNRLTGIRYTLFLVKHINGSLIAYILHPEAIAHRMQGQSYGDSDQVWYQTEMPDHSDTVVLPLQRMLSSHVWPQSISLTKCTDKSVTDIYDRWLSKDCEIIRPYEHLEYEFRTALYAITPTHLYILSENEDEFFKVPKSSFEGFDQIRISDDVGIMLMNGHTYLAFDEFMLYISTRQSELEKYNIERVRCIE